MDPEFLLDPRTIMSRTKLSSVQFRRSVVSHSVGPHGHTPGFPVLHHLPEFTQTHVHRVSDAIQPSHPLSSPSPPAPNLSQHQGLFQWVSSSHQVAKGLEFQLQHLNSFVPKCHGLQLTLTISSFLERYTGICSRGLCPKTFLESKHFSSLDSYTKKKKNTWKQIARMVAQ